MTIKAQGWRKVATATPTPITRAERVFDAERKNTQTSPFPYAGRQGQGWRSPLSPPLRGDSANG